MPTFGYLSDLGECLGDHALTEIRRSQMADKPPSTDNSTPFTKLESSEARNSATVAISSGRPIFPRGIRDSNIRFPSSVRTWSCIGVRSEEHTSELQSRQYLVCRLLLEKKKK